jgi:hypothetical protein
MHVLVCIPREFPEEKYIAEFYTDWSLALIEDDKKLYELQNPGNIYKIYQLMNIT